MVHKIFEILCTNSDTHYASASSLDLQELSLQVQAGPLELNTLPPFTAFI